MGWRRVDLGPAGLRYLIQQLESGDQLGLALARLDLTTGETWTQVPDDDPIESPLDRFSDLGNVAAILQAALLPLMADGGLLLVGEDFTLGPGEARRPPPSALSSRFVTPGIWQVVMPDLGPIADPVLELHFLTSPSTEAEIDQLYRSLRPYPRVFSLCRAAMPSPDILSVGDLDVLAASAITILTDGWDDKGLVVWSRLPSRSSMELPTG